MKRCHYRHCFSLALCLLFSSEAGLSGQGVFTASSINSGQYPPECAFDGRSDTRWASRAGGEQWLKVDFGRRISVSEVTVHWERAFAIDYRVEVSAVGKSWKVMCRKNGAKPGIHKIHFPPVEAQHLRIVCEKPGRYGMYSIWEVTFPQANVQKAVGEAKRKYSEAKKRELRQRRRALLERLSACNVEKIVFAARDNGVDEHWYANFSYYAPDRNRKCYRRSGRLCILDIKTGGLDILIDDPAGSVRDPAVHYDAGKILFSWRKSGTETFHLYEINTDGTQIRQLTSGGYDDIEPVYLPDGGIMFISSRCKRWVNCWLTQVGVLYRCNGDGADIQQISANIEHDNTPWMLPDGRVLYQRWEYVDRSQVHYHHLWTANPDGTGQMVYYGNMHPGTVMIDAKPVPGTEDVLAVFSPGHGRKEHAGYITLVTPEGGPDRKESARRISKLGDFRDPYPLTGDAFLVARGKTMYLMNSRGETMELYTLPGRFGSADLHEPRPLVRRGREVVIQPRVDPDEATGKLVLLDVYHGRNMDVVSRDTIKKLLVLETLPKPVNYTGGMEPLSYGGTFTLERIVGTVPVEEDGSAYMELPAKRSFFFVALDKKERSVKRMQSFCSVMPGEVTSCVGCHEKRTTPALTRPETAASVLAVRKPAQKPVPVDSVPEVIDYSRDIQPVWDRHCVSCHKPEDRRGGVLLTGDQGPLYSHSYFMLSALRQVADGRNLPKSNYPPRAIGDSASPLMDKLESAHYGVDVSRQEKRLVQYWINVGAPWLGTYAGLGCGMIGGYAQNRIDRRDLNWESVRKAQEVLNRRCMGCHNDPQRPLPRSPSDNMGMPPWAVQYGSPKLRFSRHILYNLSRPEKSVLLLAPLARSAGGWGMKAADKADGDAEVIEIFKSNKDPDYQVLLRAIEETKERLDAIKRFNMPGFIPPAAYVREMKRYGVLPESFDIGSGELDVYETDRAYWESLHYSAETRSP